MCSPRTAIRQSPPPHPAQSARVAVLVCGPQAMVDEVRRLCTQEHFGPSGARVRFEVHTEVFQL